jgi:phosphoribosyl 1,2-cyclic phosphodiesterase
MVLKVISSSSKGNLYILEHDGKILLLECGIGVKDIKKALEFDFSNVVGCVLSHEHLDHAKSALELMNLGIDVYTTQGTAAMLNLKHHRLNIVSSKTPFDLVDFNILPFDVQHDAAEPSGFLIQCKQTGEKLLFATDTFYLKYQFEDLNYILIECNYITEILYQNIDNGLIPKQLHNRLLKSHFSLDNVKQFLMSNDMSSVRKIVLMHLSDGNSDAGRMVREIEELTGIDTVVADPGLVLNLELYPF